MTPENSSPYAIVKTGGKQYRVQAGQHLLVERLRAQAGEDVTLEPMMYRGEDVVCDGDGLANVKVTARVVSHERGEKLRVFKFKPKRGYRRRNGHRQELTRIEVTDVSFGTTSRRRSAEPAESKGSAAESKGSAAESKGRAAESKGSAAESKGRAAAAAQDKLEEQSDGS
ncbi:MAG: 50S ribosomal protein L21 [Solirubrobacteraceae bacterium]